MVNVIGLGYIGLPTALMMASHGVEVIGTDYNKELVDTLNAGKTTFKEDGLDELFNDSVKAGVKFTTEYQVTDTYIVSVPTPYDKFSKKVDAVYVIAAVKDVMKVAPRGATVVIESTISPGTIDKSVRPVIEAAGRTDLQLVHAPERIIPGNMVYELLHNNRTIGADDKAVGEKVKELYASFCGGEIVVTDIRTAEMTKVVENTFRAVNIAFANELAKICRHDNMDVYEIIKICNMHPRVNILQPGPGVGGHCISVDPWFLVGDYPSLAKVIDESMKTNDGMPDFVLNRIYQIMKEHGLTDMSRVGLYGLTYKENVDDMRESPTLQLLASQRHHLAAPLKSYDPFIKKDVVPNQMHDFVIFALSFGLAGIAVEFAPLFFGPGFDPCATLIITFAPAFIVKSYASYFRTNILIPFNKEKQYTIAVIAGAMVNLIANSLLIPQFQALGAVYGTVLAEITVFAIQLYKLPVKLAFTRVISNSIPYLASAIIMIIGIRSISRIQIRPVLLVSSEVVAGGLVFLICCLLFWKFTNRANLLKELVKR